MTNRIAVHAWSLDRTLGRFRASTGTTDPAAMTLLDLPAALRAHGYHTVQLCHFHLPSTDAGYLAELRSALADSGITLDALLIDDGDLTDPDTADQDEAWVSDWVGHAAHLGAKHTRVIAGKTRTDTAHATASAALGRIAARAGASTRIVTENWFDVLATDSDVHRVLEPLAGTVGLLIDLGNWTGPSKYDQLASITPYGQTCHAKAHWNRAAVDEVDYRASVATIADAGYSGPFALVYEADSADEWAGLATQRSIVLAELASTR